MPFLAGGELDRAIGIDIAGADRRVLVLHLCVVDPGAAALDQSARFAAAGRQPGAPEQVEGRDAALQVARRHFYDRQVIAQLSLFEGLARRFRRRLGGVLSVQHRGCRRRQHLLRLVDLGAFQNLEPGDLVERQLAEQAQESADIAILRIAPELPVVVGAESVGIEPDRALGGLAHLGPGRRRNERRGQPEQFALLDAPAQFDTVDDVAPLVGAAELKRAIVAPRQFDEIVGLEDHVVEFQEGERLFPVQPQFHAVEGQHPVDREMAAVLAQEIDIGEAVEPVGIVRHHGIGRSVAEGEELLEHAADARHVRRDLRLAQQLPGRILAGGIADPGRAAAHQDNRLVAGLLQPAQQHDLQQAADMQAVRGAVETDIGRHDPVGGPVVQRCRIGALVDIPAVVQDIHEIGFEAGHGPRYLPSGRGAINGWIGGGGLFVRRSITARPAGQITMLPSILPTEI